MKGRPLVPADEVRNARRSKEGMTSVMDDLITWLRTQLDEVEASAARDLASIERHDFAVERLVEVDSKRRILDEYDRIAKLAEDGYFDDSSEPLDTARRFVLVMGLPYADRPGYRLEWRP